MHGEGCDILRENWLTLFFAAASFSAFSLSSFSPMLVSSDKVLEYVCGVWTWVGGAGDGKDDLQVG
jgi:hypothetical protein